MHHINIINMPKKAIAAAIAAAVPNQNYNK
jgi:hypothetical protein